MRTSSEERKRRRSTGSYRAGSFIVPGGAGGLREHTTQRRKKLPTRCDSHAVGGDTWTWVSKYRTAFQAYIRRCDIHPPSSTPHTPRLCMSFRASLLGIVIALLIVPVRDGRWPMDGGARG
eukprot:4149920-Prymnesium_polylepis.1